MTFQGSRAGMIAFALSLGVAASSTLSAAVNAGESDFSKGPLIKEYGPVTQVEGASALSADTQFKVAFDITRRSEKGAINRQFESAARFLNMHAAAGVKPGNISLAVVVHGPAVHDLTHAEFYDGDNANADLVKTLQNHGVTFYVCGQSAAFQDISAADLLPDVQLSVSAMTSHALLQQQGYTLNPF